MVLQAKMKSKTSELTSLCEARAAEIALKLELQNVDWYNKHMAHRALVRDTIDKTREVLADKMAREVKDIREKHMAVLNKAKDVYIGGVKAQRLEQQQVLEQQQQQGKAAESGSYSLPMTDIPTTISKKTKPIKPVNLVFCKVMTTHSL
jgi:phage-related minor tail protein